MFNIFGKKSLINDKYLQDNNIPNIKKSELSIDKSTDLSTTPTGKFYKAKYKNNMYSIKILSSKILEENKISEIMFWNTMFLKEDVFIKFYGVTIISSTEVGLLFESFSYSLETGLMLELIKSNNLKLSYTDKILNIVEKLQKMKQIHLGLHPSTFCITDKSVIKLIDYGAILNISEDQEFTDFYNSQMIKYLPPEKINFLTEDISSDIWSFGCLLIDLFSLTNPLYKLNLPAEEIYSLHEYNIFPQIPDDINGLLRDIIKSCLEPSFANRIKILSLRENISVLIKNYKVESKNVSEDEDNVHKDKVDNNKLIPHSVLQSNEKSLINHYKYVMEKESSISNAKHFIATDLTTASINTQETILSLYAAGSEIKEKSRQQLADEISSYTDDTSLANEIIKNKTINRLLEIQDDISESSKNIDKVELILQEMKKNIISLSTLANPKSFVNLMSNIEDNANKVDNIIKKYTINTKDNEDNFETLNLNLAEMKNLLYDYKIYMSYDSQILTQMSEEIKRSKHSYLKESNIITLASKLNIYKEITSILPSNIYDKADSISKNNNIIYENLYAKAQEDSYNLMLFDLNSKIVKHIQMKERIPLKANVIFRNKDKSLYVSGGKVSKNQELNYFFKISLIKNSQSSLIDYIITELDSMINKHSCHSTIFYSNEDYLIIVGGFKNKLCEVYSFSIKKWFNITDLPLCSSSSSLTIIENNLYCFDGESQLVFRFSLNNLIIKYIEKMTGFNEHSWDVIELDWIGEKSRINRSMLVFPDNEGEKIYLFGGFDNDNFHNSCFVVNTNSNDDSDENDDNFKISKIMNELPCATYFNSSFYTSDNTIIAICAQFNVIEYNMLHNVFHYYT